MVSPVILFHARVLRFALMARAILRKVRGLANSKCAAFFSSLLTCFIVLASCIFCLVPFVFIILGYALIKI